MLGVIDGFPGLERVYKEKFPKARIQHNQVQVARNGLTKVPHKVKALVADELRSIFYAPSPAKS